MAETIGHRNAGALWKLLTGLLISRSNISRLTETEDGPRCGDPAATDRNRPPVRRGSLRSQRAARVGNQRDSGADRAADARAWPLRPVDLGRLWRARPHHGGRGAGHP